MAFKYLAVTCSSLFCLAFGSLSSRATYANIKQLNWSFVETYAPLAFLDVAEEYHPSSIEFHLRHTKMGGYFPNYWTDTEEEMEEATTTLSWFSGQDVSLNSVPIYAFVLPDVDIVGKIETYDELIGNYSDPDNAFVVMYHFFFPFSKGKEVLGSFVFGSHVGDIERCYMHIQYSIPTSFTCEHHGDEVSYDWNDVAKVNGTHPVVYIAHGSHGVYFDTGVQEFAGKLGTLVGVADITTEGQEWRTWEDVEVTFPWEWSSTVGSTTGLAGTEWSGVPYFLYIYRWGTDSMGISAKGEWTLNSGPSGFLAALYHDYTLTDLFAEGSLVCQGDDDNLCPIPVGLWNEWPCLPGYQLNAANVTTTDGMVCFLHGYGRGHDNCREIVEPAFSCAPTNALCGQYYTAWTDETNSFEGGACPLQNCRSSCEVSLPELSSLPFDIPHWYQHKKGEWFPYRTHTQYNDTIRFDTGSSCNEFNHGLADRYHNIPRDRCLAGFVYNSGKKACYITSYQESGCYVDRAFPPHIADLGNEYTCLGSNDTCGDSWVGFCDGSCQQSYCAPAKQPHYKELMRLTHYVCDVNGNWVAFEEYENAEDEDGDGVNPLFTFDGTNVTKFTCELPSERTRTTEPEDVSGGSAGNTDGGRVVNGGGGRGGDSESGSGSTDTGSTGTGSTDTGSTGTGSTDTGSTGTGSTDTGSTDTGSTDTGSSGSESSGTGSSGGDSSGSGGIINRGGGSSGGSAQSQQSTIWNGVTVISIAVAIAFALYLICSRNKNPIKSMLSVGDRVPLLGR